MARIRNPKRKKAKEIYLKSKGNIRLVDLATELKVLDTQIRKWKCIDGWDNELFSENEGESKWKIAENDYIKGMSYKNIAKKYNVSINTVKSWKTRNWSHYKNQTQKNTVINTIQQTSMWEKEKVNSKRITNCVYRFLDSNGNVIYIGQAQDLKNRLGSHTHLPKECYSERKSIEYTTFSTKDEMDLAERYYIPKIKPKYNVDLKEKEIAFNIDIFDNAKWYKYGETYKGEINATEIHYNNMIKQFVCNKEEFEAVKTFVFATLGIDKWEKVTIENGPKIIELISTSIMLIDNRKKQQEKQIV